MIRLTSIAGSRIPFLACIETSFPGGVVTAGTGTLIGPRLLLTAGHVVFDPLHGGEAVQFRVTLGASPRQSFTVTNWRTSGQWINEDSRLDTAQRSLSSSDVGAVILDDPIDSVVHSVKYETARASVLDQFVLNVAGYSNDPNDIPNTAFFAQSRASVMQNIRHRITYPVATRGGMSGGPVWSFDEASQIRTVRAIHTSIFRGAGNALRINTPVFQLIQTWGREFHPSAQPV